MTSKAMREDVLFMRNNYKGCGRWNIPLVKKQSVDFNTLSLIACSDTRSNDSPENCRSGGSFLCG